MSPIIENQDDIRTVIEGRRYLPLRLEQGALDSAYAPALVGGKGPVRKGDIVISVADYYPIGYVAGTTDVKGAFDAAVAAAPEGATIQFESGLTHFLTSATPIGKSLTIDGHGCSLNVDPTPSGTAGTPVFYFQGTISGTAHALTSSAKNSTTVTVGTLADATNYVVGDHVIIQDLTQVRPWDYGGSGATPTYPEGYIGREEITTIKAVNTGTGVITLLKPIEWDYTASPTITKITKMIQTPVVKNFMRIHEIDPGGLNLAFPDFGPNVPHIIHGQYCHTPTVKRVNFDGMNRHCINFHRSINKQISQVWAKNPFRPTDGGHGYLARFDRSLGGHIHDTYSEGMRHHIDHVMNVDATSSNNVAESPVSAAFIGHGLGAKRINSDNDTVHDSGAAWGWAIGNLAFGPDFDFTITNPRYNGTSNGVVFHAKSQRLTVVNPDIHSTTRAILMTTGAGELEVSGGQVETVGSSATANTALVRAKAGLADPYGISPGSVRWHNVHLRGVNPAMSIDSAGSVELLDCTADEVNETTVGSGVNIIQMVTVPASMRIAGNRFVGVFSNGVYMPIAAPAGQYSFELNHFKGVTTGRALVIPAATNLRVIGNTAVNNSSGLTPWSYSGDLVAAKVGTAGYGAIIVGNSPSTFDEVTLMGATINGPVSVNGAGLVVSGAPGTNRAFNFNSSDATARWILRATSLAETGSDAGTEIELIARTDTGAAGPQIFKAKRTGDSYYGAFGKKLGFYGADGTVRQTLPAAATDAATTQSLTNAIRTMLIGHGIAV